MLDLVLSLLPLALGIVMSPLAIMALVAVLLSHRPRANGFAFLAGWTIAIAVVVTLSFLVLSALTIEEKADPPLWVPLARILLGLVLIVTAVFIVRRGKARVIAMARATTPTQVVAAAPQLPGWLHAVETFTPPRSALLGLGIFILNPVDASCAILAALEIQLAEVSASTQIVTAIVFGIVGVLPIAIPVVIAAARGAAAQPFLDATRAWIAGHTTWLNAALLIIIAVLQLQKAVSALLSD